MPTVITREEARQPDAAYVVTHQEQPRDYFDAEWSARVSYEERIQDSDLAELAAAGRERRLAEKVNTTQVLIVLNRPKRRVTLKGTGSHDGSKYFPTAEAAQAKVDELRRYFGSKGTAFRVWIPA